MEEIQDQHIGSILIVGDLGRDPDLSGALAKGNKPFKGKDLFVGLGVSQDNVDGCVFG
jgi:hypothetical protein